MKRPAPKVESPGRPFFQSLERMSTEWDDLIKSVGVLVDEFEPADKKELYAKSMVPLLISIIKTGLTPSPHHAEYLEGIVPEPELNREYEQKKTSLLQEMESIKTKIKCGCPPYQPCFKCGKYVSATEQAVRELEKKNITLELRIAKLENEIKKCKKEEPKKEEPKRHSAVVPTIERWCKDNGKTGEWDLWRAEYNAFVRSQIMKAHAGY